MWANRQIWCRFFLVPLRSCPIIVIYWFSYIFKIKNSSLRLCWRKLSDVRILLFSAVQLCWLSWKLYFNFINLGTVYEKENVIQSEKQLKWSISSASETSKLFMSFIKETEMIYIYIYIYISTCDTQKVLSRILIKMSFMRKWGLYEIMWQIKYYISKFELLNNKTLF